jgi:hypothetical protein
VLSLPPLPSALPFGNHTKLFHNPNGIDVVTVGVGVGVEVEVTHGLRFQVTGGEVGNWLLEFCNGDGLSTDDGFDHRILHGSAGGGMGTHAWLPNHRSPLWCFQEGECAIEFALWLHTHHPIREAHWFTHFLPHSRPLQPLI